MISGYFHRVTDETDTRLWINNPTIKETEMAITAGAISCTTNPSYSSRMIKSQSENAYVLEIIDSVIKENKDDCEAAGIIQQKLVLRLLNKFLPLYDRKPNIEGFVSIQGDPYRDDDANHIINEVYQYQKLSKNFIMKIPVIKEGLLAIDVLVRKDIPIIATEVMAISQAVEACEVYKNACKESGKHPAFYLTHITGIFDEYLANIVKRDGVEIPPEILFKAGTIIAHKQYKLVKERGYNVTMLGGGARGLHHFSEMVGGNMHITINWSTAKELIDLDPQVISHIEDQESQAVIDELCEKLADFRKAYLDDGMTIAEFRDFGPVNHFRNMFVSGWDHLLETVRGRRTITL